MKKPKFFLIPPLILTLCLTLCVALAAASDTPEIVASGDCGADGASVSWTLDSEGTLTISGAGAMANFGYSTQPWQEVKEQIKSAVIADGVTSIGNYAFDYCKGLNSIKIADSVTSIGIEAFYYCSGLTSIAIPDGVTSIESGAFDCCQGLTSVTIPQNVTSIDSRTFYGCWGLSNVIIPDGVTRIGSHAFEYCSRLTSVTIPDGVNSIAGYLFYGCKKLTSVTIPESVNSIGSYAFYDCHSLTDVTIPKGIASVSKYAFYNCRSLADVTIPEGVTNIQDYAFYGCNGLTSVTIPESVSSIGNGAFAHCDSLLSVQADSENAHYISEDGILFSKDRTTLVCYPAGKKDVSYQIPESVKSVGNDAFRGCVWLTSVSIPVSVAAIEEYAFASCGRLKSVYYAGSETQWGEISVNGRNEGITLWADIYYDGNRETPGKITSDIPKIVLSYAPAYGDRHNFEGIVYTEDGSEFDASAYRVTLYVDNHYPKPSWDNPSVSVKEDGSFSLYYTISSSDARKAFLDLMLIPADFDQKSASYEETRAVAIDYVEVYRTEDGGVTAYPERELPLDLGYAISNTGTGNTWETLSLTNRTGAAVEVQFAVAAYNADGRMIALNIETKSLDKASSSSLTISYSADDGVTQVRAFVLSADTLAPLRSAWVKELE